MEPQLKDSLDARFEIVGNVAVSHEEAVRLRALGWPPKTAAAGGSGGGGSGAAGAGAGARGVTHSAPVAASGMGKQRAKATKEAKAAAKAAAGEAEAKAEPAKPKFNAPKPKAAVAPSVVFENKTPAGQKKDCSGELYKDYQPSAVEAAWNDWWEQSGFFAPDMSKPAADQFVMVIPPPNVTGTLHIGHTLMCTIEDALTRWHRMSGRRTLWLPGTDHAGIATQVVVEKRLAKEKPPRNRHQLGREAFLEEVWKWKNESGDTICRQMRRLGASVDWSRERFTMDPMLSKAVTEAFVRLHQEGLIYRDTRLVNWCCALNTAIADIEVDYIDVEKRIFRSVPGHTARQQYEFGTLTSFAYQLEDGSGEIVVATTRLETMLGDVAVAVHPTDPRYTAMLGKKVRHPFCDRLIPIIGDAELVNPEFGTGAVKITPAHDPNDFACGRRHGLPEITIFAENGSISAAGPFFGMMRFDARIAIERALEERGLLRGKVDKVMRIGVCSRSGDIIEPMLKPQWWVNCKEMAAQSVAAVRTGELSIIPDFHVNTWYRWLEDCRDWCISRQLWWGHRIPAWLVQVRGAPAADPCDNTNWVSAHSEADAMVAACQRFGKTADQLQLTQDPDVLDTWFSSALFPFSTMGWPDMASPDLEAFYPGTLLETGHDILFFWVARMVMMGLKLTGRLPFTQVYLHALVRDKYGRKMSKSLGNVIDPLEVISGCPLSVLNDKVRSGNLPELEVEKAIAGQAQEFPNGLPECGADALRFGLLAYTVQGRDVNLDINRVVGYRQFCNKLWQACRFAMGNFTSEKINYKFDTPLLDLIDSTKTAALPLRDQWILSRLEDMITTVNSCFQSYSFALACNALHNFWQHEFCDVYLEAIKPVMYGTDAAATKLTCGVLYLCLDHGLRALHPIMPFVSEELWQHLPGRGAAWRADTTAADNIADPASIMLAPFPKSQPEWRKPAVEAAFELLDKVVHEARGLRAASTVPRTKKAPVMLFTADDALAATLTSLAEDIATLATASEVKVLPPSERPAALAVVPVNSQLSLAVNLEGLADREAELAKLQKKQAQLDKLIAGLEEKVANPKMPANVLVQTKEKLASYVAERDQVLAALAAL